MANVNETHKLIRVSIDDGIAYVSLHRPEKYNALNDEMILGLKNELLLLSEDHAIRALVLKGEGKNFCAGADLTWMSKVKNESYEKNLIGAKDLADLLYCLKHFPKPTIAFVQGAAMGGALGLIACCDIALATNNAHFCFSEVKLGLVPATIAPYVVAVIGERMARRYFLTAERFDAVDALNMGLLSSVSDDDELKRELDLIIKAIRVNGPQAVVTAKELIQTISGKTIDREVIQYTSELIAKLRVSPEGQEGMNAFLEKRFPNWP